VVIYILYGVCIQTRVSMSRDLKRSHPDGVCEVCHVGQYGIVQR
jgi:hypothetical protein